VFAAFLDRLDGRLQVAHIVQGVEDADDVHAVLHMQRTKASTTSSGKLAYWTMFCPRSSMSCGVLGAAFLSVRKRSKGFSLRKRRQESMVAPPQVSRPLKAHAVENGGGGEHLGGGHARGGHGLMAVPQHRVVE
jgi:hypothetical protein